jgi:phytoene desaturase
VDMSVASAPPAARAVVIGGGFGGIAAALRLRARGYGVTLVDQCPRLGGRAQVFERDGFRFDAGPTVLTAPFLFEELFTLFGRRLADEVELLPLAPWYRFTFADGSSFDYGPDDATTEDEIGRLSPRDVEGWRRFGDHARAIYALAFDGLADRPFHDPRTLLRQVPAFLRLRAFDSVWDCAGRFFEDDRVRRAFSIQPLLLGGNPFTTTSIYALINHLERAYGVWFPKGGTGAMVNALDRLLREVGVEVLLNTPVERIELEGRRVRGVTLAHGERLPADVVVSNGDPMHVYRELLPRQATTRLARWRLDRASLSMGLFVLFFGTKRQWPEVAHHTIWFGERHRELLTDIFERKVLADDFSLYLHRPTASDPDLAPAGCDGFYVLCPVPNLEAEGIDWEVEGPRLRDRIVAALDRTVLPGLAGSIATEFWMTPEDFRSDYASWQGSGFSIAPKFTQSAWFRFHNKGEGIAGLYHVGAGTHPGAGMPGVLLSARVLDHLVAPVPA